LGDTTDRNLPTNIISLNGMNITQISAGSSHSLVLTNNGLVYSFGWNNVSFINLKLEGTTWIR
jgi:alpha-tubulin suppressor-like RCC1 family protein